ncbi:uncharacterized protein [Littorina saxatilis]|uniref:Secreted protein n=1 Tax=Littorina saxatilis TaxID=31220 RepID=A0AAN9ANN0_9CAEN
MLFPVSVLLSIAVVVVVDGGGRDSALPNCVGSPSTYQRRVGNLACPTEAVCADEWNTVRDWYNGTRCKEQRIIKHCSCPGNHDCPVGNETHAFYANKKHTQYLCEPRCRIDKCSTTYRAAMEMVQNSPEFQGHNFYRINCRCRGHHFPMDSRRGRLMRSTSYMRVRFNFTQSVTYTQYRCASEGPATNGLLAENDPCQPM